MSQPTAKRIRAEQQRVTLLLHPGTPQQRALRSCNGDRLDQRSRALQEARGKYGEAAPLAWLSAWTGKTTPVEGSKP